MQKRWAADLTLTGIAFVWGITFVLVQDAIATLPPFHFLTIRLRWQLFFCYVPDLSKTGKLIEQRPQTKLGQLEPCWAYFYFWVTLCKPLASSTPLRANRDFSPALQSPWFPYRPRRIKRKMKFSSVIGVLLALCGLYLPRLYRFQFREYGDVLAFLCAIFFALQIVYTGKIEK